MFAQFFHHQEIIIHDHIDHGIKKKVSPAMALILLETIFNFSLKGLKTSLVHLPGK